MINVSLIWVIFSLSLKKTQQNMKKWLWLHSIFQDYFLQRRLISDDFESSFQSTSWKFSLMLFGQCLTLLYTIHNASTIKQMCYRLMFLRFNVFITFLIAQGYFFLLFNDYQKKTINLETEWKQVNLRFSMVLQSLNSHVCLSAYHLLL